MTAPRAPWFEALAQEVIDAQAAEHEFNEALRIADHWRHVNEDAAALVRHVANARESYHGLSRAADEAVRANAGVTAPLDTAAVLWVAAIDRVPIEERIAWVEAMEARVAEINAQRAGNSQSVPRP